MQGLYRLLCILVKIRSLRTLNLKAFHSSVTPVVTESDKCSATYITLLPHLTFQSPYTHDFQKHFVNYESVDRYELDGRYSLKIKPCLCVIQDLKTKFPPPFGRQPKQNYMRVLAWTCESPTPKPHQEGKGAQQTEAGGVLADTLRLKGDPW